MNVKRLAMLVVFFAMTGCFTGEVPVPASQSETPVKDVSLVGAVPDRFTTNGGTFSVSVSPKDQNGNLITGGVTEGNFAFKNIAVVFATTPGTSITNGSANVTKITTIAANPGQHATLVLDFDSSGSMKNTDPSRLRVAAGKRLVSLLKQGDLSAVMDFGVGTTTGLTSSRLLQDFTSDKVLLNTAIDKVKDTGDTPLYGSLLDALSLLDKASAQNPAVVVLTDGDDNGNNKTVTDVINQAIAQKTPVFPIGLGTSPNFTQLQELAKKTGGTFAAVTDAVGLDAVFNAIGFGIVQGRVIVTAEGRFNPPLTSPGKYLVSGVLVTTLGGVSVDTSFDFTVDVVLAGTLPKPLYPTVPYTSEEEKQQANGGAH